MLEELKHVRRGRRRRQCEGVDDEDGGHADSTDTKLMDNVGDVAAAAIARDLARSAAIPAGGEGSGGERGGSAGASGWLSRRLTLCCHRLLSSSPCSAASCLLMPPFPFASCAPPFPFASCAPAGCCIAPVVAPPLTLPHDFASTSSLQSSCHNSQRPTCRAAATSRPLAASAL